MLESEMLDVLRESRFHVLLLSVSKVLSREGYSDVQLLGRRTTKQKSHLGGSDIIAHQPLGVFHTRTLVKVIADDVRLRMLDEMTGAIPRCKANFGVIVTPFGTTKQVKALNEAYPGNPIRIIDGKELAYLMVLHKIGVKTEFGRSVIDWEYFQAMHEQTNRLLAFLKNMDKELR